MVFTGAWGRLSPSTGHFLADDQPQLSVNDLDVLGIWEHSIKIEDGHFQLDIPFKSSPPELPDNKVIAEARLLSLGRRLTKNPQLHEKYTEGISNLIKGGYAEKCD